jgi:hypothetical protein
MKLRCSLYVWLPVAAMTLWTAYYLNWRHRHPVEVAGPLKQMPPTVMVWPERRAPEVSPEVAAIRRHTEELLKQLAANRTEERRLDLARAEREGIIPITVPLPPSARDGTVPIKIIIRPPESSSTGETPDPIELHYPKKQQ